MDEKLPAAAFEWVRKRISYLLDSSFSVGYSEALSRESLIVYRVQKFILYK